MSTAGVFSLIVNDGKSDRMIHASKLLYQRIQDIMFMRTKQGRDDITPSLIDLERTHIIYVNAHFKPFAAIGFEYNKILPQSGGVSLGGSVTFSIPQFGDFFHDMVCRVKIDKANGNIGLLPTQSSSPDQTKNIFPNNNGNYSYNIVDIDGNVLVNGGDPTIQTKTYRNFVRYCEFPGNRLFSLVKFDVNGNPLDEYDQYVPTMLEKFTVPTIKRSGYNTLVGQQNILQGVGDLHSNRVYDADSDQPSQNQYATYGNVTYSATAKYNTPTGITPFDNTQSSKTVPVFTPINNSNNNVPSIFPNTITTSLSMSAGELTNTTINNTSNSTSGITQYNYDLAQNVCGYVNGPQTPKVVQPPLEIWNKLRFWFNDDIRLSIPSVSIPYGQRFITINLNDADNLLYESPSIFLESIFKSSTNLLGYAIYDNCYFYLDMANTSCTIVISGINQFGVQSTANIKTTYQTKDPLLIDLKHYTINDITFFHDLITQVNTLTFSTGIGYVTIEPINVLTYENAIDVFFHNTNSLYEMNNLSSNSVNFILTSNDSYINCTISGSSASGSSTNRQKLYIDSPQTAKEIKTYTSIYNKFGITTPKILAMELYVNNIFVNPEIHDIFIRRIGFALIRVYRQQKSSVSKTNMELLLSSLKWPIEYMFVGFQPIFNQKNATMSAGLVTGGNVNSWRDWHRMTRQLETTDGCMMLSETTYNYSSIGKISPYKYYNTVATVDSLSVVSHGIKLYDTFSDIFFNNYQPYHFGEKINTPEDPGAFFINFALFPGTYQPSGHLNISRARETYLNFNSSYCSTKTPCCAIIVAIAINFILISDGSCCLRYST